MTEEKKDSKSKVIIILLIIVIILLIGGGVTAFVLLSNNSNNNDTISQSVTTTAATDTSVSRPKIGYDDSAVALDQDSLQKAYDEMHEKTQEGYISLSFQNEARSKDGLNYTCRFGNSESNTRDMYVAVYLDDNYEDEYYLSGLLRPGQMITTFTGSKVLEPGEYEATLVLTQVEDDHETLSYQTSVVLTLKVDTTGQ